MGAAADAGGRFNSSRNYQGKDRDKVLRRGRGRDLEEIARPDEHVQDTSDEHTRATFGEGRGPESPLIIN
jgi:hypothetical protein